MILLAQEGDHRRITLLTGHSKGRIARQELLQPEDDNRNEEQSR
jgi:hypothetical protein